MFAAAPSGAFILGNMYFYVLPEEPAMLARPHEVRLLSEAVVPSDPPLSFAPFLVSSELVLRIIITTEDTKSLYLYHTDLFYLDLF